MNITPARSWIFNVNNLSPYVAGGVLNQNQFSVLGIKNVLKGGTGKYGWLDMNGAAVSAPSFWTVDYSATNLVAGVAGDGVDRWAAYSDLVWGNLAGANSWIVLKNTTAGLWWLISCENSGSDSNTLDMYVSTDAFVGGTTTARPTATNELNMLASTTWGAGAGFPIRFHVLMSADGLATRVFTTRAMSLVGVWLIEPLGDPSPNVQGDYLTVAWGGSAGNPLDFNTSLSQTARNLARKVGGPAITGVLSMEGSRYVNAVHSQASLTDRMFWNDFAAQNSLMTINAFGIGYPTRGRVGSLVDLWVVSDYTASNRSWPGNATRQLMSLGPLVIPWPRIVPETY